MNLGAQLECDYKNSLSIQMKTGLKFGHLRAIGTYENTLFYLNIRSSSESEIQWQ